MRKNKLKNPNKSKDWKDGYLEGVNDTREEGKQVINQIIQIMLLSQKRERLVRGENHE